MVPGVETDIVIPNIGWVLMTLTFRESMKSTKLIK